MDELTSVWLTIHLLQIMDDRYEIDTGFICKSRNRLAQIIPNDRCLKFENWFIRAARKRPKIRITPSNQ